ncbi:SLAM family member 5 isoform X2 [Ctenopharyngodon idella]|uniref:SLAM family member 5 isoform X2 n=1 Tax=Ctenopharyngodon idella TaxID=7959 RepID=UPI00222E2181|nr:SLAM family member 5 isoform X2 [Ctenopharyngodon idella]
MNIFQPSCLSILGVLLVFFLQGSCTDQVVEVHKAVGDSLDLIADYPKENLEVQWKYKDIEIAEYDKNEIKKLKSQYYERLEMNADNISITVKDLKLQDSVLFSIVAKTNSTQHPTKFINLHVHDLIRDVQIESNDSWLSSKNICMFHLWCQASGDPNSSYSWSGYTVKTGQNLNISLHLAESATLNCTANNTISVKHTTKTVECREPSGTGFLQMYLLIAGGVGIIAVVIFSGTVAACCRWRKHTGKEQSEGGNTVYEDVNTDGIAKKRTESVVNGMTIYETVDDMKGTQNLPQTLYDKINYQRHPAVSANTSSPYQEVL